MNNRKSTNGGFVQLVLLAIVIIAILAYYKVDLRTILDKPIFHKLINIFVAAWGTYVKPLLMYLWTSISALFK